MSNVGTERIAGTRCLVCLTRASPALTGSLRTDRAVRPRASYVRQSPVRPSQQPTLKRHRGHWNVPWRHSIAAAQRGQGSTAGSGVVPAGDGAAIRRRYGAGRTAGRVWVPRTPSGHPPARAGPHSGRPGSPFSRPHARESRNARLATPRRLVRTAARPGFTLSLQNEEAPSSRSSNRRFSSERRTRPQSRSIVLPEGVSAYQAAPKSLRPSPLVCPRRASPEKK